MASDDELMTGAIAVSQGATSGRPRSISSLGLLLLLPAVGACLLSEHLVGERPLHALSRTGALPWLATTALTAFVFSAAYMATRHRYSYTYGPASGALLCLAVYSVPAVIGSLDGGSSSAIHAGATMDALRWTFWVLPAALGLWMRTVFAACDEGLRCGDVDAEHHTRIAGAVSAWKARRFISQRFALGDYEAIAYVVIGFLAALALIQPYLFIHRSPARDAWGETIYAPTVGGEVAAAVAVFTLAGIATFASLVWSVKPRDITSHAEARLHLVGTAAWLAAAACFVALFSNELWPRPIILLAFGLYFLFLCAALVHAASTQEVRPLQSSTTRRAATGCAAVAFAVAAAAVVLPHAIGRAATLSALVAAVIPLAPVGFRGLFGFQRPPAKDGLDEVQAVAVDELEGAELAHALQTLMATGTRTDAIRPAAVEAIAAFVQGLHEATEENSRPRPDPEQGKLSSDIRRIIAAPVRDLAPLITEISSLPAFTGTQDQRLNQLRELVCWTALQIERGGGDVDTSFKDPQDVSPKTRTEFFLAYIFTYRRFPDLADEARMTRLSYTYKAWSRAAGIWQDLIIMETADLQILARARSTDAREVERRRKLGSHRLDVAARDIQRRWLRNLGAT